MFATCGHVLVPVIVSVSVSVLSGLSVPDTVELSLKSRRLCSDGFSAQSAVLALVNESSVFFPNRDECTVNKAPGVAAVIICRPTEIQ